MTKRQRHKYYKMAFDFIKATRRSCICLTLDKVSGRTFFDYNHHWPEFAKRKPKNKTWNRLWFGETKIGQQKRLLILKKCIKETAPKSNKQPSKK